MKTAMILFAGVMIASSVAMAGQRDPLAEERFKAKYGRYTPSEEIRREAQKSDAASVCCRLHRTHEVADVASWQAASRKAWFQAKYGRVTPGAEGVAKAMHHIADANAVLREQGCCKRAE